MRCIRKCLVPWGGPGSAWPVDLDRLGPESTFFRGLESNQTMNLLSLVDLIDAVTGSLPAGSS